MAPACVAVAYSGGRDSTALLHATLAAAEPLGLQVLALHVHHGLQPAADAWLAHCRARCARWARASRPIGFDFVRLADSPQRGDSIEAWARGARYRALGDMAQRHGCSLILLAHHRRDQAETVLLQALRGAGLAGLSAMPVAAVRDGVTWQRPWLTQPSHAIDAYVRRHRLHHIEDTSNADPRHARNRLRSAVWPALVDAFPGAEAALAASAAWAQQARACLDELALQDLVCMHDQGDGLALEPWQTLSPARRSNALRAWLALQFGQGAPATLVQRLMDELPGRGTAQWPCGPWLLRRYRGHLRCDTAAAPALGPSASRPQHETICLSRPGRYATPAWAGSLVVEAVESGGVASAWLAHAEFRPREGGERFQAGLGRPPRSLKKQYQALGIAARERGGPLVYSGGQLIFAPGLGLDARVLALPGQPQLRLEWQPDAAGGKAGAAGPRR